MVSNYDKEYTAIRVRKNLKKKLKIKAAELDITLSELLERAIKNSPYVEEEE